MENPPGDYSLGRDLRASGLREWTVVADWSRLGIVDHSYKLTIPIQGGGLLRSSAIATWNDQPLSREDAAGAWRSVEPKLRVAIEALERFRSGAELRLWTARRGATSRVETGASASRTSAPGRARRRAGAPGVSADRPRRFRGRPASLA